MVSCIRFYCIAKHNVFFFIFIEAARKKYPWMKVDEPATPGDYPVVGFCENIRFSSFRNNQGTDR